MTYYLPFFLVVVGGILYHLGQKAVPKTANPFKVIIIAYFIGIILCALCTLFMGNQGSSFHLSREMHWSALVLGVGAAVIEIGFLLAYRAGWDISIAALTTNVGMTLCLIPLGILIFNEHLSLWNVLGIIFCILGLFLISLK